MTATSERYGQPVWWDENKQTWRLVAPEPRTCPRCGKPPTTEGFDACIGYIPGATYACCGHGTSPANIVYDDMPLEVALDAVKWLYEHDKPAELWIRRGCLETAE